MVSYRNTALTTYGTESLASSVRIDIGHNIYDLNYYLLLRSSLLIIKDSLKFIAITSLLSLCSINLFNLEVISPLGSPISFSSSISSSSSSLLDLDDLYRVTPRGLSLSLHLYWFSNIELEDKSIVNNTKLKDLGYSTSIV